MDWVPFKVGECQARYVKRLVNRAQSGHASLVSKFQSSLSYKHSRVWRLGLGLLLTWVSSRTLGLLNLKILVKFCLEFSKNNIIPYRSIGCPNYAHLRLSALYSPIWRQLPFNSVFCLTEISTPGCRCRRCGNNCSARHSRSIAMSPKHIIQHGSISRKQR